MKNTEKILIVICLLGVFATGATLLRSKQNSQQTHQKESLGSIESIGEDVRIKSESDRDWNSVTTKSNVYHQDHVYTGDKSEAHVELKTKEKFKIEPHSLVVIEDAKESELIDLNKGGLLAEIKKGQKLLLKIKDKVTEISSDQETKVHLLKNEENLSLRVIQGQAEVKKSEEAEPIIVAANTTIEVSEPVLPTTTTTSSTTTTTTSTTTSTTTTVTTSTTTSTTVTTTTLPAIGGLPDELIIHAGVSMTGISASDKTSQASATFYSPSDIYLSVAYQMNFDPDFGITFFAGIKRHHFNPVQNANKTLDTTDIVTQNLGLTVDQMLNPGSKISFVLKQETRLFARGLTSQVISLDPVPIPVAGASYERRILDRTSKSLWLGLSGNYLAKSFNGGSGSLDGSELSVWLKGKRNNIDLELGLRRRSQNSDAVTQVEYQTYLSVGYSFDPFK